MMGWSSGTRAVGTPPVPIENAWGPARPARVPEGLRLYAIGDVHGRADLLDACLAGIEADAARHPDRRARIVFLGDLIDRGPDSRAVLDRVLALRAQDRAVALSGNHEAMLLDAMDEPAALAPWSRNGGVETLRSYGISVPGRLDGAAAAELVAAMREAIPEAHRRVLRELGTTWRCGDYLLVHAGIRPGIPAEAQDRHDLLWIREPFLGSRADHGAVVVHGHTPVPAIDVRPNRINIDTGAYATGRLTCLVLEGADVAAMTT